MPVRSRPAAAAKLACLVKRRGAQGTPTIHWPATKRRRTALRTSLLPVHQGRCGDLSDGEPWRRATTFVALRAETGIGRDDWVAILSESRTEWAICIYTARRYEDAITALKGMHEQHPESRLYLAASYAQLGQDEEAEAIAAEVLEEDPDFSTARWAETEPYVNQADRDHIIDGLRKAGLPE